MPSASRSPALRKEYEQGAQPAGEEEGATSKKLSLEHAAPQPAEGGAKKAAKEAGMSVSVPVD